jgi:hypothetical protein
MTFIEKRRHERVTVFIDVYWGWTPDCTFRGRIISLSIGGYFLRTEQGGAWGRPIFVKFWLPDERTLGGEVRYHMERWGVGVEFKGLSADESERLAALVEHYRNTIPQ